MCNIAGYVGDRDAAPILIDLIKRQEGWAGGFYTGLATVHEGKIYYAKLVGDTDRLTALTDAAKLPGKIGIIHSRSKGGGDDEWSHPFLGFGGKTAYVANGSAGFFKDGTRRNLCARDLFSAGYRMRSVSDTPMPNHPSLEDGRSVHTSDVMCQQITRYIDRGFDAATAMEKAFCDIPSEIVGLTLSLTDPDAVFWARINMPMNVAFAPQGAYLASAPTAFPADANRITPLPALSCGSVTRNGCSFRTFQTPPCTVAPITGDVLLRAFERAQKRLETGKCSLSELAKLTEDLFSPADCRPKALLSYLVLKLLSDEGKIRVVSKRVPGVTEALDAPKFYAERI